MTRAQLSQRKPTVAFVCYWQTDDIHTLCDLGYRYLKTFIVAVCAKSAPQIRSTILALYKLVCMYVCRPMYVR